MTTTFDFQSVTTPTRFRLPAGLVSQLNTLADSEGIDTEELAARLLVGVLPEMVAERTERWLRTTLSLAYPLDVSADVPGIRERGLDDDRMALNAFDAIAPPAPTDGATTSVLTAATVALTLQPGDHEHDPKVARGVTAT